MIFATCSISSGTCLGPGGSAPSAGAWQVPVTSPAPGPASGHAPGGPSPSRTSGAAPAFFCVSVCQTPAPTGEGGCKEVEAAFYKEAKPSLFPPGPPLGEQQHERVLP